MLAMSAVENNTRERNRGFTGLNHITETARGGGRRTFKVDGKVLLLLLLRNYKAIESMAMRFQDYISMSQSV